MSAEKHETPTDRAPTVPHLSETEIFLFLPVYECEEWEARKRLILGATLHQITQ